MRALEYETDERLLIEATQKDPLQFGRLYEANFERVYAYIVRRVGDRDAAQELKSPGPANVGRNWGTVVMELGHQCRAYNAGTSQR